MYRWVLAVVLVAGCATVPMHREMTFTPRNGASPAVFAVPTRVNSGPIEIALSGQTYRGTWLFMSNPGDVSATNMGVFNPERPVTAVAITRTRSTAGQGRVLLKSEAGAGVECTFDFSFESMTGMGGCQGGDGSLYDLTITNVPG